ncbi:MAG: SDR family NAD(P)-dependent oxidoreductase, partial [Pseudomonadales bacterium]|nr:SDR family NAD(P)-dependent oxidoreductase [Pseudomonadales bacterium]
LLDINVMGTFRVNQAFLPLLQSGARIVNISSETGWQSGGPFNGAYAMSKHAIEAYSDSLRRELCFLGIAVIKIQPGPFKTEMVGSIEQNFSRAIADTKHFSKQLTRIKALAMNEQNKAHDPAILASAVYKALTVKKPKPAYSVKADPARSFLEWFPTAWADGLLKKVLG